MGEPFRPNGRDDDGLADWFRQADSNHDGQLTIEEMQKDAERFFALLDVNHDGEIDPDEITRYENVVVPEIQSGSILAWPRSKVPRVKAAATTAVAVTIAAVVEEVSSGAATMTSTRAPDASACSTFQSPSFQPIPTSIEACRFRNSGRRPRSVSLRSTSIARDT